MAIEPEILKQAILTGYDIEFSVDGQKYTIIPWTENGIIIGPQNSDNDQIFSDADALLSGYQIGGIPLQDKLQQAEILFM
ncbi:MAG: hypothetical protein KHY77_10975 [Butyricicoccus pullicaecorum]|nr:hypothetical protein [Butyricicoccus pullicaecorum]